MAKTTIAAELKDLFGVEVKEGESVADFSWRLVLEANEASDDDWEKLSTAAQKFVNAALLAHQNKEDIPTAHGVDAIISGGDAEPETDPPAPEESVTEEAPKKVTKKAAAKKAVPAKPKETKKAPAKKVATKAAPEKKANVAAKKAPAPRGPRGLFSPTGKIKLLTKENPYRAKTNSYGWFGKYKNGMTVAAAIESGVPRHHIRWDLKQGNIEISA